MNPKSDNVVYLVKLIICGVEGGKFWYNGAKHAKFQIAYGCKVLILDLCRDVFQCTYGFKSMDHPSPTHVCSSSERLCTP